MTTDREAALVHALDLAGTIINQLASNGERWTLTQRFWAADSEARALLASAPSPQVETVILADKIEGHLEFLANRAGGLSLIEWNPIANDILSAIAHLRGRGTVAAGGKSQRST